MKLQEKKQEIDKRKKKGWERKKGSKRKKKRKREDERLKGERGFGTKRPQTLQTCRKLAFFVSLQQKKNLRKKQPKQNPPKSKGIGPHLTST